MKGHEDKEESCIIVSIVMDLWAALGATPAPLQAIYFWISWDFTGIVKKYKIGASPRASPRPPWEILNPPLTTIQFDLVIIHYRWGILSG